MTASLTQQKRDLRTLYIFGVIFGLTTALGIWLTLLAIEEPDGMIYLTGAGVCLCAAIFCVIAIKGAFGDLMRHMTRAERALEHKQWEIDELQKSHEYLLARLIPARAEREAVGDRGVAPAATNVIQWPVNGLKQ